MHACFVTRPFLPLLGAALALASPAASASQQHFPAAEDVRHMLRYLVEDGETPGIVLAFIDADGSTRVVSYGDGGPGTPPLGQRSAFEIGSITKTFTAALLADMVTRGEMALDDPVRKYLPDRVTVPTWEGRAITLMDLATHHSGLPRMPDNFEPSDPANPYADYTVARMYDFLGSHELRHEPGAEYEYSNLAVGLLGHVIERAAGKEYEALVRERILDPLGMSTTGVTLRGELASWMTKGHDGAGDVVPHWDVTGLVGAGGLRSNAEDMLRYIAAQVGPAESSIERAMRMTHEPRMERDDGGAQGLGWGIRRVGSRRMLAHGGGTAGYSTYVGFDPDLGVGVVMLTNTGDFDDDIASDFLRRGAPLSTPTVDLPQGILEGYVGVYGPDATQGIAVRLEEEGWLTMQAPGNVRFRMYADSDTSFYVRRTPWRFTFQKDADGAVSGVVADLEGTERRAQKLSAATPDPRALAGNPVVRDDLPPLTPEEMARYEGEYSIDMSSGAMTVRVFVQDGALMGQPAGQRSTRLLHQGDHTFIVAADTDDRLVFVLENGRAERVTLHEGGRTSSGVRLKPGEAPPRAPEVQDLPITADEINRYEGTYLLKIGARTLALRVFGRGGRLISQATGQSEAPLRYQGDHIFVPNFDDRVRLVFTVEDGRARLVTLHQGGSTFSGEREPQP
jgi:D-alanyl-D-alanine-carboxypeptidase/D-alanyl-D-alanine-endopeptidase